MPATLLYSVMHKFVVILGVCFRGYFVSHLPLFLLLFVIVIVVVIVVVVLYKDVLRGFTIFVSTNRKIEKTIDLR